LKTEDLAIILTCPLFQDEKITSLARDIESLPYRMSTAEDGQIVRLRNEPYNDLIIIISGSLQAFQEDRAGHQLIVESLSAPDAVATAMLFAPRPRIPVSLRADGPCRLFSISRHSVLKLCARYPGVLQNLLNDMGSRAAFLADKLRFQTFASIKQKLAAYLTERLDTGETEFPVNKEKLAEIFGVNRPSLSRVCHDLTEAGIIRQDGRTLIIADPAKLRLLKENMDDR
jgi:CRP-like cAMP-binding protein